MFRNVVCRVGARIASASAADVAASLRRRSGALLPSTAATTQRAALFHTSATPRFANGAANGRPQQTERGYEEKIDPHDPDSSVPLLQVHDDIKLLAEEARLIDQTEPSGIEENLPAPEGEVEFDTTKTDLPEEEEISTKWFGAEMDESSSLSQALLHLGIMFSLLFGLYTLGTYIGPKRFTAPRDMPHDWLAKDLAIEERKSSN